MKNIKVIKERKMQELFFAAKPILVQTASHPPRSILSLFTIWVRCSLATGIVSHIGQDSHVAGIFFLLLNCIFSPSPFRVFGGVGF